MLSAGPGRWESLWILLIDNYDSFSYNLVQLAGSINPDIRVVRNDAMPVEAIEAYIHHISLFLPGLGPPGCWYMH